MTDTPVINPGLISRVTNILLRPAQEWEVIRAEPSSVQSLFVGYAVILAAIGPIAELIGGQIFGISFLGVTWRPDLSAALAGAVVGYVTSLAGVFLLGLVIEALAPTFGGSKDRLLAMKVAVYSWTAAWLAGIFGLVPALGILALLGLYSLYLLYLGLGRLMGAPPNQALVYTLVTIVVAVVIFMVVGWLSSQVIGMFGDRPTVGDVRFSFG